MVKPLFVFSVYVEKITYYYKIYDCSAVLRAKQTRHLLRALHHEGSHCFEFSLNDSLYIV